MKRTFTLFLVIPTISIPYLPSDFDDDLPEKKPWVPPPGWEPPF